MSPEELEERMQVVTEQINAMHGRIMDVVIHFMELMEMVRVRNALVLASVVGILMLVIVEVWRTWFPDESDDDTRKRLRSMLDVAITKYAEEKKNADDKSRKANIP